MVAQKYLTITPDIKTASMDNGIATIPFTVTNNSTEAIAIPEGCSKMDDIMMLDDSGQKVFIECFHSHHIRFGHGRPLDVTVLIALAKL